MSVILRPFLRRLHARNRRVICALAMVSSLTSPNAAYALEERLPAHAHDPVLIKIYNAFGGIDTIRNNEKRTFRSEAEISTKSGISGASNTFHATMLERAGKLRMEMKVMGQPNVVGFDGKQSWQQNGNWVSSSPGQAGKRLHDEIKHGLNCLLEPLEAGSSVRRLPDRKLRDRLCHVLEIVSRNGTRTIVYSDQTSGLVLRTEYEGIDHELGTQVTRASEYFDYRPVAGTVFPHKITHLSGSRITSSEEIKHIEPDDTADDSVFNMPPESEVARVKGNPLVVPFEYIGNEIMIKVRLNNGFEGKFIVDTGASQTVIDKHAATALGPYTVSTFTITAGSKAVPLSYTTVKSLGIGDVVLQDVPVLVSDLSSFAAAIGERPAGLLGANILRRFLVIIDYDERKIVFADPKAEFRPNGIVVPTSPVFGATALVVHGELDGRHMNFLVDTGAAFNNLPTSLARTFDVANLPPVGEIYGLDGQRLRIGSVKLNRLKLGSATIPNPVFAVAPDSAAGPSGGTGLFTAGTLGILGNPIWSQFRVTVDYRNERLILESSPNRERLAAINTQLEDIDRRYVGHKNVERAIQEYQQVLVKTQTPPNKAAEALAVARLAGCYGDKFQPNKEYRWLDIAAREYERAYKLAVTSCNRSVEAQVLAQWAMLYLFTPRSQADLQAAQDMLARAIQKSPMESSIYAVLGSAMLRKKSNVEAEKLIDQALMMNPANWQALWMKYKIAKTSNPSKAPAVLAQLRRYYPGSPDVVAASSGMGFPTANFGKPGSKLGTPPDTRFGTKRNN